MLKSTSALLCLTLSLLMGTSLSSAHPPTYSARDIRGQIVDEETGLPLAGVIVVAQWALIENYFPGADDYKGAAMEVREVTSDLEGRYVIPGWGPRPRPPFHYLDSRDPLLAIFKIGYVPQGLENEFRSKPNTNSLRTSQWNEKVIKLKKDAGPIDAQAFKISSLYGTIASPRENWRLFPRMLLAMQAEKLRLKALGLKPGYASSIPAFEDFSQNDQAFLLEFQ